jgi:hypothetical protein
MAQNYPAAAPCSLQTAILTRNPGGIKEIRDDATGAAMLGGRYFKIRLWRLPKNDQ